MDETTGLLQAESPSPDPIGPLESVQSLLPAPSPQQGPPAAFPSPTERMPRGPTAPLWKWASEHPLHAVSCRSGFYAHLGPRNNSARSAKCGSCEEGICSKSSGSCHRLRTRSTCCTHTISVVLWTAVTVNLVPSRPSPQNL
jgi:hypothetical protein